MTTIGERIAELRKNRGMTQENLAEIIGVSAQSVSKWENSTTMPDIMLLPIIADTFEVSIDYLFGKTLSNAQNINADNAFDSSCEALKKLIFSSSINTFNNTKSFESRFKEYKSVLESDSRVRSIIIRNHGVVYYREEVGGLLLKKPKSGWGSLFEDEEAIKIILLLSNKDFCKALATIIKTNMSSFTLSSLCNSCKISAMDEFKDILMSSGFFEVKSVNIDDNDVEIYNFNKTHRLFVIFAILQYAKEFANYENVCYYYFGDANFLNE